MKNKNRLKGLQNEDEKPFYISDYQSTKQSELQKKHKNICVRNESRGDSKDKLQVEKGTLLLDGSPIM